MLLLQDSASVFKWYTTGEYADSVVSSEILVDLLSSCGKPSVGTYLSIRLNPVAFPGCQSSSDFQSFQPLPRSNLNPSNWHFQFFSVPLDLFQDSYGNSRLYVTSYLVMFSEKALKV